MSKRGGRSTLRRPTARAQPQYIGTGSGSGSGSGIERPTAQSIERTDPGEKALSISVSIRAKARQRDLIDQVADRLGRLLKIDGCRSPT